MRFWIEFAISYSDGSAVDDNNTSFAAVSSRMMASMVFTVPCAARASSLTWLSKTTRCSCVLPGNVGSRMDTTSIRCD